MVDVLLKSLVDLRRLLHHLDGIADLVVLPQKLHQLDDLPVVRIALEDVRLGDSALDPTGFAQFSGKLCAHEHTQHPVDAGNTAEHIGIFCIGVQCALNTADMQIHIQMHMLRGAVHIGAQLQLRAELIAHSAEQRVVADLHEVVGTLHGRIDQTVLVQCHGVLAVLLHQMAGPHIAGFLIEVLHQGCVLCQMAHRVRAGLSRVGHVDDEFLLLDDVAGHGDDVLKSLQRLLHRVHPGQIHRLLHLTVGKLELVVRLGDAVHKEAVELAAAQRAHHTANVFLINRVYQRFVLSCICHGVPR